MFRTSLGFRPGGQRRPPDLCCRRHLTGRRKRLRTGAHQPALSRRDDAAPLRTGSLTVAYDREFATAFGLGGTSETKELSVQVNMPLARKVYTHSVLSWRSQQLSSVNRHEPAVSMVRSVDRVPRAAVGAHRGVLRNRVPDGDDSWHHARSDSFRVASGHRQTDEGSLMEDTRVHALDYVSAVRRRKWWLVVPIVTSVFVGLALVRFLPKEYRSTTTLGVAASIVSPNLVNQTTPLDNQERMRALSQQLVSLPILARVVREERLGSGAPNDPQIRNVRRAIEISVPEPVATTNEVRRLDTFIVSYSDEDPARAQRIANRLATVFVDENSKLRAERAEDTSAFIATQFRASQARLAGLEARLRKSKEAYMGRLPEQTSANLQTLSGLRQQLEAKATALRGEQDRLSMIERQLEGLKQGTAKSSSFRAVEKRRSRPSSAFSRCNATWRRRARCTPTSTPRCSGSRTSWPARARTSSPIAIGRRRIASVSCRPTRPIASSSPTERWRGCASANYSAPRPMVSGRSESTRRVSKRRRWSSSNWRRFSATSTSKNAGPDLSAKLQASTIAENVERNRSGEQFTILYPASYPNEPTKPVPWRVMLIAIAGGLCLGGALSLGREYLDRSVHDVRDLKDEFEIPVSGK